MVPVPVPVPYIRGRAGQPGATLSLDACERRLSIGVNINESPTDMVCGAGGAPSSDYAMDLSRNHVIHTHTPRSLRSVGDKWSPPRARTRTRNPHRGSCTVDRQPSLTTKLSKPIHRDGCRCEMHRHRSSRALVCQPLTKRSTRQKP